MHTRETVLREASAIRLLAYVQHDLNDNVDYRTGEILPSREYEAATWQAPAPPEADATVASLDSHTQMTRFLGALDKRTLKHLNYVRRYYDIDKGSHHLTGSRVAMSNTTYCRLNALVERIDYANIILTTPEDLAQYLSVRRKDLYRYLSSLGELVRVRGARDGIQRGSIKVEIHPAYGYRHPRSSLESMREQAITDWTRIALMQASMHHTKH